MVLHIVLHLHDMMFPVPQWVLTYVLWQQFGYESIHEGSVNTLHQVGKGHHDQERVYFRHVRAVHKVITAPCTQQTHSHVT